MKRKYLIMTISIIIVIAIIVIGIIFLPSLRTAKSDYEYSVMVKNRNKAFEEMVAFCEENQDEIEAYSSRYLEMKQPDMSGKELGELEDQIAEELECKWMFEEISVIYPNGIDMVEGIVPYHYKDFEYLYYEGSSIYESLEMYYIYESIEIYYVEEEISQQEFEELILFETPNYLSYVEKINDHLYVCETGYMGL